MEGLNDQIKATRTRYLVRYPNTRAVMVKSDLYAKERLAEQNEYRREGHLHHLHAIANVQGEPPKRPEETTQTPGTRQARSANRQHSEQGIKTQHVGGRDKPRHPSRANGSTSQH